MFLSVECRRWDVRYLLKGFHRNFQNLPCFCMWFLYVFICVLYGLVLVPWAGCCRITLLLLPVKQWYIYIRRYFIFHCRWYEPQSREREVSVCIMFQVPKRLTLQQPWSIYETSVSTWLGARYAVSHPAMITYWDHPQHTWTWDMNVQMSPRSLALRGQTLKS